MSEMVERVARALRSAIPEVLGEHGTKGLARVAIEAMREPSFAMVTRGMGPHRNTKPEPGETLRETNVRNSYRAMIDAALTSQTTSASA